MGPGPLLLQKRWPSNVAIGVTAFFPDVILPPLPVEGAEVSAIDPRPVLRPPEEVSRISSPKMPRAGEESLELMTSLTAHNVKRRKIAAPIRASHHHHLILSRGRGSRVTNGR